MFSYVRTFFLFPLVACFSDNPNTSLPSGQANQEQFSGENQVKNSNTLNQDKKQACYQLALHDLQEYLSLTWQDDEESSFQAQGHRVYTAFDLAAQVELEGKKNPDGSFFVQAKVKMMDDQGKITQTLTQQETWQRLDSLRWLVNQRQLGPERQDNCLWHRVNCQDKGEKQYYDGIMQFSEGYAIFEKQKLQGIIDSNYREIIAPQFKDLSIVKEGTFSFQDTATKKYGVYSLKQKKIIVPPKYEGTHPQNEGLIAFLDGEAGAWGFMNEQGQVKIKPQFISINIFDGLNNMHPFNEGLANVMSKDSESLFGYINTQGQWVVKPKFGQADAFKNGRARVYDQGKQVWYYINKQGQCIQDCP